MKKLFAVLFFSFFGFGCNPSNQSTEARSEELPITINPVIERVFLKIDSAVFPDIEVAIH